MNGKKIWNIILLVLLGLQTVAEVLCAVFLIRLDMLPGAYVAVLLIVLVFLLAGNALLMFVHGKKPVSAFRRIVCCVLSLIVVVLCCTGAKLGADAHKTIDVVTNRVTTTTRNVYVFVLQDDPAVTIGDAAEYTFGYVEGYDIDHTQGVILHLGDIFGQEPSLRAYAGAAEMVDGLYDHSVDALIMNGVSVAILIEDPAYADFVDKVRILEDMSFAELENLEPAETTQPTEPDLEKTVVNSPFIVYVSGSDTLSKKLLVSRSDVNILMIVNPVTKQILLLNTPRDYYVENPAGNGARDKLTHCGLYGPDCSMEALENLYNISIDYYGQINFTGFKTLVDAVGGVTVHSDQAFRAGDTYIQVGENQLNGEQALSFARERYRVADGDRDRGKNQMKVIKAVVQKMTSGTTVIANYSSILQSLEGMFSTSIKMEQISMLVKMQLSDMATWNIQSFAVTGVGGSEKTYSMPGSYAYVMYEDEGYTAYASELIERVLNGDVLKEEDVQYPQK